MYAFTKFKYKINNTYNIWYNIHTIIHTIYTIDRNKDDKRFDI